MLSASRPFFGILYMDTTPTQGPRQGSRLMELTQSFLILLQQNFVGVFTVPTFQTFLQICNGWVLSHRHRFITDIIFSGGNVGNGHWAPFHRFFSDASWNLDTLNMFLTI